MDEKVYSEEEVLDLLETALSHVYESYGNVFFSIKNISKIWIKKD